MAAAGNVPQQNTTQTSETSSPVTGPSGNLINADMVQLFSAALALIVARQVMVVGDPLNPLGVAQVSALTPSGNEQALMTRLSPGSPELQILISELRMVRAELQQVVNTLGGIPLTAPPLIDSQQGGS